MSLQELEKVVRARFLEIDVELERCRANPVTCDPKVFTAQEGPMRAFYVGYVQSLVEHKWVGREPLDDPSYTVVQSITFDEKRTRATVLSCKWDTAVLLQPGASPDGSDIIVNDLKNSSDVETSMVLENGKWMMAQRPVVATHEGVNTCPPKG
jgi:hypothetical protein